MVLSESRYVHLAHAKMLRQLFEKFGLGQVQDAGSTSTTVFKEHARWCNAQSKYPRLVVN
eukprot:m.171556 g.171556  ORF g.171556 m.171556 type:complete len:60 (+) comp14817_c0_seq2:2534-2713(+)